MNQRNLVLAAALVVTLGLITDAHAATGDPTGTTYGLSGRNYGTIFTDFGAGLFFSSEAFVGDFTGDEQLSGVGSPEILSYDGDGTEKIVNELAIRETYGVYDPATTASGSGITGSNDGVDVPIAEPFGDGDGNGIFNVPIPNWDAPGHVLEIKVRDTLGNLDSGGGINRDFFSSSILRVDDINPTATTPNGGTAVPMLPGDRDPEQLPSESFFSGQIQTWFFYYELNGAPANSPDLINLGPSTDVLEGDHPILGAAQKVYYPVFNTGDLDATVTHDIAPGTLSFSVDTELLLGAGGNMVNLADALGLDSDFDFDTIVFGALYHMIAEGDGNLDGKVDGLDYLLWASNFGTDPVTNPAEPDAFDDVPGDLGFNVQQGDYNKDGAVTGLDYLLWAGNFGFVGDGSDTLSAAVPEPGTLALACLALAGMGLSTRRRR